MVIGEDLFTEKLGPEKNLAVADNLLMHVANQWYIPCCSGDCYRQLDPHHLLINKRGMHQLLCKRWATMDMISALAVVRKGSYNNLVLFAFAPRSCRQSNKVAQLFKGATEEATTVDQSGWSDWTDKSLTSFFFFLRVALLCLCVRYSIVYARIFYLRRASA
jgi:hypothetical protein